MSNAFSGWEIGFCFLYYSLFYRRWRENEMRGLSDHGSVCMSGQTADIVICFQYREEQREPSIAGHVDPTSLVSLFFSQTLTHKVRHTWIHGNLSMTISWNPMMGLSCIQVDSVSEEELMMKCTESKPVIKPRLNSSCTAMCIRLS